MNPTEGPVRLHWPNTGHFQQVGSLPVVSLPRFHRRMHDAAWLPVVLPTRGSLWLSSGCGQHATLPGWTRSRSGPDRHGPGTARLRPTQSANMPANRPPHSSLKRKSPCPSRFRTRWGPSATDLKPWKSRIVWATNSGEGIVPASYAGDLVRNEPDNAIVRPAQAPQGDQAGGLRLFCYLWACDPPNPWLQVVRK